MGLERCHALRYRSETRFRCTLLLIAAGCVAFSACASGVVQHNNAGNTHFSGGDYEQAITEYRQAQVTDPDRAEPYYNAANAFSRQAQFDAVQAQAQQALKTAHPDLAAWTWYNLGNAYFDTEAWRESILAYQEALRITPDDPDAKHNLELALKRMNEEPSQQRQNDQTSNSSDAPNVAEPTASPNSQPEAPSEQEHSKSEPIAEAVSSDDLTPEQALQLLHALVDDSETLQQRLGEIHMVPAPPPAQDW